MNMTKENITQFYEDCFNKKQIEVANNWLSEDYIQHNPGLEQGRAGFIKAFKEKFSSIDYFYLKVEKVLLDDDYAVVFLKNIDVQGKTKARVVDLYRISNDRFVEHWDYFDVCK